MPLHQVGFFPELNHGHPTTATIHNRLSTHLLPDIPHIVTYLTAGTTYAVAAGPTLDIFKHPAQHIIGPLSLYTDGTWLWPSDLAYYVQHYHVALPDKFITHMRAQHWTPPQLSEDQVLALRL